jgi:Cu(I)/Ag(I) efflux system membrane fusion protein
VNLRRKNDVLIAALIAAAMIGVYTLGRHQIEIGIAAAVERKPLYYQDPSGKPDYSPTPKKDAEGRDYVPVYDEPGVAPTSTSASPAPAAAPRGERKLLYYRVASGW